MDNNELAEWVDQSHVDGWVTCPTQVALLLNAAVLIKHVGVLGPMYAFFKRLSQG